MKYTRMLQMFAPRKGNKGAVKQYHRALKRARHRHNREMRQSVTTPRESEKP